MLKPNIGTLNALIRIACGLTLLSWGTATLFKRSYKSSPMFAIMAGSMKVAEGITRFCPLVFLYRERRHADGAGSDSPPMNPS